MHKAKAWIFALLLVGACALAPAAHATDAAKIDRLLVLFRVPELSKRAVQGFADMLESQRAPEAMRNCYARAVSGDALVVEMRNRFSSRFAEPAVADATISFLASPAGSQFIESAFQLQDNPYALTEGNGLTPAGQRELDAFVKSPAGSRFQETVEGLEQQLQDSMFRIAGAAACGPAAAR